MNPILKANPILIFSKWEETNKITFTTSPYTRNFATFIEHMLIVFSSVKLYSNSSGDKISMTTTLKNLAKLIDIKTPNGMIPVPQVFALIKLAYKVNRSMFIKDVGKNSHLAGLTPLFMYAHKLYNDVSYESWDKTDTSIEVALGKFLYRAYQFQEEYPDILSPPPSVRKAKLGKRKLTDWPRSGIMYSARIDATEDPAYDISYDMHWLLINFQFWIANAELRKPSAMILDMNNWDNVPAALDTKITVESRIEDLPWS